jgi:hypothetical protein
LEIAFLVIQFRQAIADISQLPNLEMNFRRGDSLLDYVCGVSARVALRISACFQKERKAIHQQGRDPHKGKKGERKRKLRVEILRHRPDLSDRLLSEEIAELQNEEASLAADFFGGTASDAEKRRQVAAEIERLQQARAGVARNRKVLEKLVARPFDSRFNPELRKLEGADFDSPFNFSWHIDFADIFSRESSAGIPSAKAEAETHEFLGKQAKACTLNSLEYRLQPARPNSLEYRLQPARLNSLEYRLQPARTKGGFDLVLGNPPFVTARNPEKRELYRTRWKRVCSGKYLLVCPLLRPPISGTGTGDEARPEPVPEIRNSFTSFAKHFHALVRSQSVPDNIP